MELTNGQSLTTKLFVV